MALDLSCLQTLRRRLYALLGALVLATACLQALGPIDAPLERSQGSAFSAATADVAIVRARAGEVLRQVPAPVPPLLTPVTLPVAIAAAGIIPESPAVRPDSTGPPLRSAHTLRPGPRAPPRA